MANGEKGIICDNPQHMHVGNHFERDTCINPRREQPQEPSFEGIGSFHGAANQDSHSRSPEGGEKPVAYRQAPRPSGQISLAPELEPATPAPGAPFADIGEFHEAANHDSHAAASPRSGMGANWLRQRHFFVTGCDKGALVTLDDALAHAAEQVRQVDNLRLDALKLEVEAMEKLHKSEAKVEELRQERDALADKDHDAALSEKALLKRAIDAEKARERAERALREIMPHIENALAANQEQLTAIPELERAVALVKSSEGEAK